MISEKMEKAINDQINAEMWSAYLYLSMSAYFLDQNLSGFANWMKVQYQEEVSHAMKFFGYLAERGGRVTLKPISEVPVEWSGPVEIFEETLKHERHVTSLINNLMNIAFDERDHASVSFLQWFIDEQVEEESNADEILKQLRMIGDQKHGIFFLDRELGSRTFVDSTQSE